MRISEVENLNEALEVKDGIKALLDDLERAGEHVKAARWTEHDEWGVSESDLQSAEWYIESAEEAADKALDCIRDKIAELETRKGGGDGILRG